MPVEIVGRDTEGEKYRLNRFEAENMTAERLSHSRRERAIKTLRALAERLASRWRGVFPHDKIEVRTNDDD